MKYLLFLYFKSESKSVNVWRKEMLQSVYPLYTFPDNIYFVYVPGKNTFEPKINYLLKVFLRLTEKFLRIFLRSLITCVNASCIHLNKMYTPLFAQFIGMPLLKQPFFLHHNFCRIELNKVSVHHQKGANSLNYLSCRHNANTHVKGLFLQDIVIFYLL